MTITTTANSEDSAVRSVQNCWACNTAPTEPFFQLRRAPVICHTRYTSAAAASSAPVGQVSLVHCAACGLIYNGTFDPSLIHYDVAYDNALHHSAHFRTFASSLANQLCQNYEIKNKNVVEVGCGDGYFLNLICEAGNNRGWGFDPTVYPRRSTTADLKFVTGYFDRDSVSDPIDLIVCRHVLEHLPQPRELMSELRHACSPNTIVYLEVPDGDFTFERGGIWDVLYEHCSYYSAKSLTRLFEAEGFEVLNIESTYHGQFLAIEAKLATQPESDSKTSGGYQQTQLQAFAAKFDERVEYWNGQFAQLKADSHTGALWGAGTKGVMFLNALSSNESVSCVVDINPEKQNTFITGTRVPVVGPADLMRIQPKLVLLMNPAYRDEVSKTISQLGLDVTLAAV